jgi:DNA-binding NarL/FixJ family response regulator
MVVESDQIARIGKQIEILIRLVALDLVDERTRREQIRLLDTAGFAPKEIAEFLGTTSNTVSVELHGIRKKDRVGKRSQKRQEGTK